MRQRKLRANAFLHLSASAALIVSVGCAPKAQDNNQLSNKNFVQAGDLSLVRTIGDENKEFLILGKTALESKIAQGELHSLESEKSELALRGWITNSRRFSFPYVTTRNVRTTPTSLLFGMPLTMINEPIIFGSVITEVSDRENENLGGLKLADLPPLLIKLSLQKTPQNKYYVTLTDCGTDCSLETASQPFLEIPAVAVDSVKNIIILDLSSLGKALDLVAIRNGDPRFEQFQSKSSQVVRFDYSQSVLVFDVEAHLIKKAVTHLSSSEETVITNRWYMKPAATFNSAFASRKATPGVGFFMTERNESPVIQRWDLDRKTENEGIKYYIKNVPVEYQAPFKKAFDSWNEKLHPVLGKKILSYEFISEDHPNYKLLVAGDPRFNVLEWDLVNKAGYGGLGPSLANQNTGEIFQGNVLIQGPTIVGLYSKWFKANETATSLRALGQESDADQLLHRSMQEIRSIIESLNERSFKLRLGDRISLRIRSQDPSLEDPMISKEEFDLVPAGYTYEQYMAGYFYEMVAHELGHNLGLRHNFKGNLGATDDGISVGSVSRSIMEYLGRRYRYLNDIGAYDLMAIAYGYMGEVPKDVNWYCTDEDAATALSSTKSAECSPSDATGDPFGFYKKQLNRAIDLIVARGKASAPEWTPTELKTQIKASLQGLGAYVSSAQKTSQSWTNFFDKEGRPKNVSEIKPYVLDQVKSLICDSSLAHEEALKESAEAATKVRENLTELKKQVADALKFIFTSSELNCSSLL